MFKLRRYTTENKSISVVFANLGGLRDEVLKRVSKKPTSLVSIGTTRPLPLTESKLTFADDLVPVLIEFTHLIGEEGESNGEVPGNAQGDEGGVDSYQGVMSVHVKPAQVEHTAIKE
jgi:hypothetical protein